MKTLLLAAAAATALASATSVSAGSLDPVGDRIGYHSHNGCQIVVYAQPRTALFGLIPVRWDYTREGRICKREYDAEVQRQNGGDGDNDREYGGGRENDKGGFDPSTT